MEKKTISEEKDYSFNKKYININSKNDPIAHPSSFTSRLSRSSLPRPYDNRAQYLQIQKYYPHYHNLISSCSSFTFRNDIESILLSPDTSYFFNEIFINPFKSVSSTPRISLNSLFYQYPLYHHLNHHLYLSFQHINSKYDDIYPVDPNNYYKSHISLSYRYYLHSKSPSPLSHLASSSINPSTLNLSLFLNPGNPFNFPLQNPFILFSSFSYSFSPFISSTLGISIEHKKNLSYLIPLSYKTHRSIFIYSLFYQYYHIILPSIHYHIDLHLSPISSSLSFSLRYLLSSFSLSSRFSLLSFLPPYYYPTINPKCRLQLSYQLSSLKSFFISSSYLSHPDYFYGEIGYIYKLPTSRLNISDRENREEHAIECSIRYDYQHQLFIKLAYHSGHRVYSFPILLNNYFSTPISILSSLSISSLLYLGLSIYYYLIPSLPPSSLQISKIHLAIQQNHIFFTKQSPLSHPNGSNELYIIEAYYGHPPTNSNNINQPIKNPSLSSNPLDYHFLDVTPVTNYFIQNNSLSLSPGSKDDLLGFAPLSPPLYLYFHYRYNQREYECLYESHHSVSIPSDSHPLFRSPSLSLWHRLIL